MTKLLEFTFIYFVKWISLQKIILNILLINIACEIIEAISVLKTQISCFYAMLPEYNKEIRKIKELQKQYFTTKLSIFQTVD